MNIQCKKCQCNDCVKSGLARGMQRYKCKGCGYHFVEGDKREKMPKSAKALALLLYGMGKCSYGFIGKLLGISRMAVCKWIKAMGYELAEPEITAEIQELEFDEMWHFLKSKKTRNGSGKRWIVAQVEPSPGLLAVVIVLPSKGSMPK